MLAWQIDQRCLRLLVGFRGWPIQWNHVQCCGATLVAMATKIWQIWATFSQNIDSSFLFLGGIEPFLAVISPCGTLQNVVLRFLI